MNDLPDFKDPIIVSIDFDYISFIDRNSSDFHRPTLPEIKSTVKEIVDYLEENSVNVRVAYFTKTGFEFTFTEHTDYILETLQNEFKRLSSARDGDLIEKQNQRLVGYVAVCHPNQVYGDIDRSLTSREGFLEIWKDVERIIDYAEKSGIPISMVFTSGAEQDETLFLKPGWRERKSNHKIDSAYNYGFEIAKIAKKDSPVLLLGGYLEVCLKDIAEILTREGFNEIYTILAFDQKSWEFKSDLYKYNPDSGKWEDTGENLAITEDSRLLIRDTSQDQLETEFPLEPGRGPGARGPLEKANNYYNLANLWAGENKDMAIKYFKVAGRCYEDIISSEFGPQYKQAARTNLIQAYLHIGDISLESFVDKDEATYLAEAIRAYDETLKHEPNNIPAHKGLFKAWTLYMRLYYKRSYYLLRITPTEAEQQLAKASSNLEKSLEGILALAKAYVELNMYEMAAKIAIRALSQQPENAQAHWIMIGADLALGQFSKVKVELAFLLGSATLTEKKEAAAWLLRNSLQLKERLKDKHLIEILMQLVEVYPKEDIFAQALIKLGWEDEDRIMELRQTARKQQERIYAYQKTLEYWADTNQEATPQEREEFVFEVYKHALDNGVRGSPEFLISLFSASYPQDHPLNRVFKEMESRLKEKLNPNNSKKLELLIQLINNMRKEFDYEVSPQEKSWLQQILNKKNLFSILLPFVLLGVFGWQALQSGDIPSIALAVGIFGWMIPGPMPEDKRRANIIIGQSKRNIVEAVQLGLFDRILRIGVWDGDSQVGEYILRQDGIDKRLIWIEDFEVRGEFESSKNLYYHLGLVRIRRLFSIRYPDKEVIVRKIFRAPQETTIVEHQVRPLPGQLELRPIKEKRQVLPLEEEVQLDLCNELIGDLRLGLRPLPKSGKAYLPQGYMLEKKGKRKIAIRVVSSRSGLREEIKCNIEGNNLLLLNESNGQELIITVLFKSITRLPVDTIWIGDTEYVLTEEEFEDLAAGIIFPMKKIKAKSISLVDLRSIQANDALDDFYGKDKRQRREERLNRENNKLRIALRQEKEGLAFLKHQKDDYLYLLYAIAAFRLALVHLPKGRKYDLHRQRIEERIENAKRLLDSGHRHKGQGMFGNLDDNHIKQIKSLIIRKELRLVDDAQKVISEIEGRPVQIYILTGQITRAPPEGFIWERMNKKALQIYFSSSELYERMRFAHEAIARHGLTEAKLLAKRKDRPSVYEAHQLAWENTCSQFAEIAQKIEIMLSPLVNNPWISSIYLRSKEEMIEQYRNVIVSLLIPDHAIKQEAFAEVDALTEEEILQRANAKIREEMGLDLRELFIQPTVGRIDIIQLLSIISVMPLASTLVESVAKQYGREYIKGIIAANYTIIKAIDILSKGSDTTLIQPQDIRRLFNYLSHVLSEDARTYQPKGLVNKVLPALNNLLSLIRLCIPADTIGKKISLINLSILLNQLRRLQLWRVTIDRIIPPGTGIPGIYDTDKKATRRQKQVKQKEKQPPYKVHKDEARFRDYSEDLLEKNLELFVLLSRRMMLEGTQKEETVERREQLVEELLDCAIKYHIQTFVNDRVKDRVVKINTMILQAVQLINLNDEVAAHATLYGAVNRINDIRQELLEARLKKRRAFVPKLWWEGSGVYMSQQRYVIPEGGRRPMLGIAVTSYRTLWEAIRGLAEQIDSEAIEKRWAANNVEMVSEALNLMQDVKLIKDGRPEIKLTQAQRQEIKEKLNIVLSTFGQVRVEEKIIARLLVKAAVEMITLGDRHNLTVEAFLIIAKHYLQERKEDAEAMIRALMITSIQGLRGMAGTRDNYVLKSAEDIIGLINRNKSGAACNEMNKMMKQYCLTKEPEYLVHRILNPALRSVNARKKTQAIALLESIKEKARFSQILQNVLAEYRMRLTDILIDREISTEERNILLKQVFLAVLKDMRSSGREIPKQEVVILWARAYQAVNIPITISSPKNKTKRVSNKTFEAAQRYIYLLGLIGSDS
ncbi:MAG: hypothetical protein PVI33_05255, partial [Candidatus Omnitrophota bacterium]